MSEIDILKAVMAEFGKDISDQVTQLGDVIKQLDSKIEEIGHGLVQLSEQQDILKQWIDYISSAVEAEMAARGPMRD